MKWEHNSYFCCLCVARICDSLTTEHELSGGINASRNAVVLLPRCLHAVLPASVLLIFIPSCWSTGRKLVGIEKLETLDVGSFRLTGQAGRRLKD